MTTIGKRKVAVDVGARLKQLREDRRVSMRTLAKNSSLSANALSMIERGLTSPSVSTLSKLAGALEVPITAFFRREPDRQKVVFRQSVDRVRVPMQHGLWEDLGGDCFSERMEAFIMTLDKESSSGLHAMTHSGSEFVFVLSGQLSYEVDGQQYEMLSGDSLMFAGNLNHRWCNPGPGAATALITIATFDEDERPGEYHTVVRDHEI